MSPRSLVALVALAPLVACAMSQRRFGELSTDVSARNAERHAAAEALLRAKGYVFVDDEALYASPPEEFWRHCHAREAPEIAPDALPIEASERVRISVTRASRADRLPPVPVELEVAAPEACSFFERPTSLEGTLADGRRARLEHVGDEHRLARDRCGQLVLVAVTPRVVSRRRVLVERSCDHMPAGEPSPLERGFPIRVALAAGPLPRVAMPVDVEELDVECTENTY